MPNTEFTSGQIAFGHGFDAFYVGAYHLDCPYSKEDQPLQWDMWNKGYHKAACEERAERPQDKTLLIYVRDLLAPHLSTAPRNAVDAAEQAAELIAALRANPPYTFNLDPHDSDAELWRRYALTALDNVPWLELKLTELPSLIRAVADRMLHMDRERWPEVGR